ncbi:MAG TPA: hypothetical protein VGD33_05165 [Chitinophagaceae bacterium]
MKRVLFFIAFVAIIASTLCSCASTRDCQGVRKTRLANGITI